MEISYSERLHVRDEDATWRWHARLGHIRYVVMNNMVRDAPLSSAPGKTNMHGLIMESTNDICSLFDSYLPNHEASTHEITWRM